MKTKRKRHERRLLLLPLTRDGRTSRGIAERILEDEYFDIDAFIRDLTTMAPTITHVMTMSASGALATAATLGTKGTPHSPPDVRNLCMADVSARKTALLLRREHDFPDQGPEADGRILT